MKDLRGLLLVLKVLKTAEYRCRVDFPGSVKLTADKCGCFSGNPVAVIVCRQISPDSLIDPGILNQVIDQQFPGRRLSLLPGAP